jgi:putative glutamine amidotransferase
MSAVIVISGMFQLANNGEHWFSAVRNTYSEVIAQCGATPVIAPVSWDQSLWRRVFDLADGILLSGGDDIHPELYNQSVTDCHKCECDARDAMECQFVRWAFDEGKPLLGICRGMQVVNVAHGGCLHSLALNDEYGAHDERDRLGDMAWDEIVDEVSLAAGSKLIEAIGETKLPINSLHRHGVKTIGSTLKATGWSKTGLVEVIESATPHPFYVGVQFHPEALSRKVVPEWRRLFEFFVDVAKKI